MLLGKGKYNVVIQPVIIILVKSLALVFASSVPSGLSAQQQNAWLYNGGGLEMIREIYRVAV
ncbi:TRAP transporter solute receptor, unknown substrate 6 [Richelia intracellularis HM01]|nr:TRAP transporter solute receptor, unknown substrate 6 [Richelia intracellularis HM01]